MDLLDAPLAGTEFLAVDTETNGLGGDACELTEIGAVLVGGGELHDRWSSLVRPSAALRRGIQRFTGISQAMVDQAPWPDAVLPALAQRLQGRVMVAHNAAFDRRVLRQAFARVGLDWPDPPVLCTAALARVMLPLQRERKLTVLADALSIEVAVAHRALADAETCGRVFCALFPRLCANAGTVAEAVAALRPKRPARGRARTRAAGSQLAPRHPALRPDFGELPRDPGVYLFRDASGRVLYVGKSVSIRSRARAHFAPSAGPSRWTAHATVVDYRTTCSELGALVLENRLIKQLAPPGNTRLTGRDDRLVYIRCRLDIPFPILEVAADPAAGHAVTIGPLHGRRLASELVEQLDSLFGLRHCGRRLPRREHPSAYGQMGRCLSPCLGDLDPNLYRRRLDAVLRLFCDPDPGRPLLDHVDRQMRAAATEQRYERAAALRRRRRRLSVVLEQLGGVLEATHVRPRLVLAPHPVRAAHDAFWIVEGRLVDWGPAADLDELETRTVRAMSRAGRVELGAHVPPDEIDEVRLLGGWLASHPGTPQLGLDAGVDRARLGAFLDHATELAAAATEPARRGRRAVQTAA
ncbi:MAG TPA: exonuclease domain-containing protein [Solirubrobacteraceae bacterium]|nr:exonuclease domain-containing protein [Solirubrobacteraceae bacterium]